MARLARPAAGFTLIELLVTISIMALMTLLSWRGIDGMMRTKDQLSARSDQVLTLQTALTQWTVDLDNLAETRTVSAADYDGSVLRMTRRDAVSPSRGLAGGGVDPPSCGRQCLLGALAVAECSNPV